MKTTGGVRAASGLARRVRRAGDGGATLVEAVIVLPLLFTMIFGILEIGGALKSYSSASNAVRAGGRAASVAGNDAMADQFVLERMAREAAGIGSGEIEYVVVWHADGPGETVPAGCVAAAGAATTPNSTSLGQGGSKACNVYVRPTAPGGAFDMARGLAAQPATYYFGCTGSGDPAGSHKLDCNWSPKDRKVGVSPRGTPLAEQLRPDHLGVHIRATHTYLTGILGDDLTITENGINLLEPDNYGVVSP